jgi:hypothetical protein
MPEIGYWSYSRHLDNTQENYRDVDEVRFLYQDTDPGVRLLSDSEVSYQIVQWIGTYVPADPVSLGGSWQNGPYDHPLMAAHGCALRVAAKFAGVVAIDADGVSVAVGDLQARYTVLAAALKQEYERVAQSGADVDFANLMWDDQPNFGIRPTTFGIGMDDNPLAGQQDFGGMQDWAGFGSRTDMDGIFP